MAQQNTHTRLPSSPQPSTHFKLKPLSHSTQSKSNPSSLYNTAQSPELEMIAASALVPSFLPSSPPSRFGTTSDFAPISVDAASLNTSVTELQSWPEDEMDAEEVNNFAPRSRGHAISQTPQQQPHHQHHVHNSPPPPRLLPHALPPLPPQQQIHSSRPPPPLSAAQEQLIQQQSEYHSQFATHSFSPRHSPNSSFNTVTGLVRRLTEFVHSSSPHNNTALHYMQHAAAQRDDDSRIMANPLLQLKQQQQQQQQLHANHQAQQKQPQHSVNIKHNTNLALNPTKRVSTS